MTGAPISEAVAARAAGDPQRAEMLCAAMLRGDANDAEALAMLGVLAQEAGDLTRACEMFEAALAARPADARTLYNLAIVHSLRDDVPAAIDAYERAVTFAPSFAAAQSNLGNLYARRGTPGDALRAYAAAIAAQPDFAAAYCNLAALLVTLERDDEAIRVLETASRAAPAAADVFVRLAHVYRRRGRMREARAATWRALEIRPNFGAYLDLSLAAFEAGDYDVALDANLRALAIDPESAAAHANCGTVYLTTGRHAEAAAACRNAIARSPQYPEAHVNLALALLASGDFAAGWDEYAWTWRLPARRPSYPFFALKPAWNGETFPGRRLLITREQGFGDAIQAVRYLPAVKARGGQVILETAPELVALFSQLDGVDELRVASSVGTRWEDVDLHVPVLGLPRAFATDFASIPAPVPYLHAPRERIERWHGRLQRSARLRIGIVWCGSGAHVDDRNRSVRLEDFAPLGAIDGIAWFGLQKGRDDERRSCGPLVLDPLGPQIDNFADTAAIVTQLDLVIAVDTSIVHLAGALGKPVWTLLPFAADWRWLRDRSDSPWYPTMRLFRQPRRGDWNSVFIDVAQALAQQLTAALR